MDVIIHSSNHIHEIPCALQIPAMCAHNFDRNSAEMFLLLSFVLKTTWITFCAYVWDMYRTSGARRRYIPCTRRSRAGLTLCGAHLELFVGGRLDIPPRSSRRTLVYLRRFPSKRRH